MHRTAWSLSASVAGASTLTTFALLHGGGLGEWCWNALSPELASRGYESVTVDFSPDDFSKGASHCAQLAADACRGVCDATLVAHSIAGLFAPLVPDLVPIERIAFIHALLPMPGVSLVEQLNTEPDMFNPDMFDEPKPFWDDFDTAHKYLLHDCDDETAHRAFGKLRPETGVLGQEPSPLTDWPNVDYAYIVCDDDKTATPRWASSAASARLKIQPIHIPGGHCPMLSRPRKLADTLIALATERNLNGG